MTWDPRESDPEGIVSGQKVVKVSSEDDGGTLAWVILFGRQSRATRVASTIPPPFSFTILCHNASLNDILLFIIL